MTTILVANTKGGCGKTTLATNLAGALAAAGHATALADVDRQRSSLGWLKRRDANLPAIRALDWSKEIDDPPRGLDHLVIDAPAALAMKQVEALVRLADVIILPVLPSAFDAAATDRFLRKLDELKPIAKKRIAVAVVGNRLRARTRAAERLDDFLGSQGQRVVARLRDSAAYAEAAATGGSIFDLPPRRGAALRSDWQPLLARIEDAH